ncbi:MAG: dihydrofolate reductase family protein [Saprospiraceae bacterium]
MRSILLQVAVTLDGFIEGPHGEIDWCFTDQDYGMSDFLQRIDTIFMGRKTFDMMQSMPTPQDDPFTAQIAHVHQFVFSQSLDAVDKPGTRLITGDTITWIKNYMQTPGKDIWLFGGASFTNSLVQAGLVHEIILAVHPILLGAGKSFLSHAARVPLHLLSAQSYDSGLVMMRYQVV